VEELRLNKQVMEGHKFIAIFMEKKREIIGGI
jgi:hypothetical protein